MKTRVGKRQGNNQFAPITYKCSNKNCKYHVMTDSYGISKCAMCGEETLVIAPKSER